MAFGVASLLKYLEGEGGRDGGREGEGGREGGRDGGREGGREEERERGGREGGREGGSEGRREGGRRGKEGEEGRGIIQREIESKEHTTTYMYIHRKMTLQKRCSAEFRISKRYGRKTDINKTDTACAFVSSVLLSHPTTAFPFCKNGRE